MQRLSRRMVPRSSEARGGQRAPMSTIMTVSLSSGYTFAPMDPCSNRRVPPIELLQAMRVHACELVQEGQVMTKLRYGIRVSFR